MEAKMITEHDLELMLAGDEAITQRLTESLYWMADERCRDAIKMSRPENFRHYIPYKKGKERSFKETQHDWDADFLSAVGMGIAIGLDKWKKNSRNPTNPAAFISYVLSCIDSEIRATWKEKGKWKRLSTPETAEKLRFYNPELVAWIEDRGSNPYDFRLDREGFALFVNRLTEEEWTVLSSQVNVEETAKVIGDTVYGVKKIRQRLRERIETLLTLAV
jgi:hypothetical protein